MGSIADNFGLPVAMNVISLLPILGIVLAFTLPDDRPKSATIKTDIPLEQEA